MAVLSDSERLAAWAELMRRLSDDGETVGITKAELRAALDAVDTWIDGNAASFNAALPQPARSSLSVSQKALMLVFVVDRRFEVL